MNEKQQPLFDTGDRRILAVLFAAGEPLELERLAEGLGVDKAALRQALERLQGRLQEAGLPLELLELAGIVFLYFRMFSRNISKRYQENQAFLRMTFRVREPLKKWQFRFRESRQYHIYKCPSCGQKIRIPRGRDRVSIHCPKCGTDFIKKS